MSKLTDTRSKTHGEWRQNAGCAQALETAMLIWRTATLKPHHREALHQICVKMARINCGDPDFPDHWDDIAGYADETAKICRTTVTGATPGELAANHHLRDAFHPSSYYMRENE
jgi:hypothetical protein